MRLWVAVGLVVLAGLRPVAADDLPASPLLRPVVAFWVDVFTRWSVDDVVLHDRLEPETIYTVLRLSLIHI